MPRAAEYRQLRGWGACVECRARSPQTARCYPCRRKRWRLKSRFLTDAGPGARPLPEESPDTRQPVTLTVHSVAVRFGRHLVERPRKASERAPSPANMRCRRMHRRFWRRFYGVRP